MRTENRLFQKLGIVDKKSNALKIIADKLDISVGKLKYYDENNILPYESDLLKIENVLGISKFELMLSMGILDSSILQSLNIKSEEISKIISQSFTQSPSFPVTPIFTTEFGKLYETDCINLLNQMQKESVDLIFADPPFNLDKAYESGINDDLANSDYLKWCEDWLSGCINVLKDGGSLFIWNIPKWNTYISNFLNNRLTFKHWISVDIKYSLPIQGKLYPSHYSLLYYVKGQKPNFFKPDRLPMELCKNCYKELKDYGGYKDKMNPAGINISDVWYDIPPVRHTKYKNRDANELPIKLLDRIIEMSTEPGDTVFDPFGGSGTTYIASELKGRKWIGVELGSTDDIVNRFSQIDIERLQLKTIRKNLNKLFPDAVKEKRKQVKLWTDDTFR